MINPPAKLSVRCQAIMPRIRRGSRCQQPRPVLDAGLKLMHRNRKLQISFAFAGSLLVQEGFKLGRLPVARLMNRMGRVGKRHGFGRIGARGVVGIQSQIDPKTH